MANTLALGASAARLAGSSPAFRTKNIRDDLEADWETVGLFDFRNVTVFVAVLAYRRWNGAGCGWVLKKR
jgi:hypothetical protein